MVRGRKKVSAAWPHFEPIINSKKFKCAHCNMQVVGPGCSNLKKHLQARHKEIFLAIDELDKSAAESGLRYVGSPMERSVRSDSGLGQSEVCEEELSFMKMLLKDESSIKLEYNSSEEMPEEEENKPVGLIDMLKQDGKGSKRKIDSLASSLVISNLTEQCETLREIVDEKNAQIASLLKENEALKLLVQHRPST